MREFVREYPNAVLFGGWATHLRTGAPKSHDIDVIVDHPTLDRLRSKHALSESRHIGGKKFELKIDGVGVDVYPVYQSRLGRELQLPVEALYGWSERLGQVRVLTAEAQFAAKMAALLDRPDTLPGEKDREEMWELLKAGSGLNFHIVGSLLRQAGKTPEQQVAIVATTFDLLSETSGLSKADRSALHRIRNDALDRVRGRDRDAGELER